MDHQDLIRQLHCLSEAQIADIVRRLSALPPAQAAEQVSCLTELIRRERRQYLHYLFPDQDGWYLGRRIFGRSAYPRHMEFFEAQKSYMQVCAMAANRVGKTLAMGGYSTALHLTGLYPAWWPGRRFRRPIAAWAAGKTGKTTRDIIQPVLMGAVLRAGERREFDGTGLIPGDLIDQTSLTWEAGGTTDLMDAVRIKHVSGGWSVLGFKSYAQGRGAFEGTARDLIWLDEEPPMDVYGEALIRLATTNGLMLLTFTPLEGLSETALQFLPSDYSPAEKAA